jgi:hypothetical protein
MEINNSYNMYDGQLYNYFSNRLFVYPYTNYGGNIAESIPTFDKMYPTIDKMYSTEVPR